jgi:hypothetical protein
MRNDQQLFAFKIMTLCSSVVRVISFSKLMAFKRVLFSRIQAEPMDF